MTALLAQAVGHLLAGGTVPPSRSRAWRDAAVLLDSFAHCSLLCGRSSRWLWLRLHGIQPPRSFTWMQLFAGWLNASPDTLLSKLNTPNRGTRAQIFSWNVRWLVNMTIPKQQAKKARIFQALEQGFVVCLPETHWLAHDEALWRTEFPLSALFASNAVSDPAVQPTDASPQATSRSDRRGGVAILLPPGCKMTSVMIPLPGYCISCEYTDALGLGHRVVSCYLESGNPTATWDAILAFLPPRWFNDDTIITGDMNADLSDAGCDSIDRPDFGSLGVLIHPGLATCCHHQNKRIIDGAVVPPNSASQWSIKQLWTGVSDHSALCFTRREGAALDPPIACTPARFWGLPAQARAELRRRFHDIACALSVPMSRLPDVRPPQVAIPEVGHLALDEPIAEGPNDSADCPEDCPVLPLLATIGHRFLNATFVDWWRRYRVKADYTDGLEAELRALARGDTGTAVQTSPALLLWLQAVGGPASLTPPAARRWLCTYKQTEADQRRQQLSKRVTGPSVSRDRPALSTRVGRAIRKKKGVANILTLSDGTHTSDPRLMAKALLATRADIWFQRSARLKGTSEWLAAYGHRRQLPNTAFCLTDLRKIRGAVMAPAGSGVGDDGIPCEALQLHPQLTACILAQGMHILQAHRGYRTEQPSARCTNILDDVLGPARELLIWIPKEKGNTDVSAQRPLNLPRTLRRLFGAIGMNALGPQAEKLLDPGQAAVAGGSCHKNIQKAFQHLHTDITAPTHLAHCHWACRLLFGKLTDSVITHCRRLDDLWPSLKDKAACLMLDQAKAFEDLSHEWLRAVWAGSGTAGLGVRFPDSHERRAESGGHTGTQAARPPAAERRGHGRASQPLLLEPRFRPSSVGHAASCWL